MASTSTAFFSRRLSRNDLKSPTLSSSDDVGVMVAVLWVLPESFLCALALSTTIMSTSDTAPSSLDCLPLRSRLSSDEWGHDPVQITFVAIAGFLDLVRVLLEDMLGLVGLRVSVFTLRFLCVLVICSWDCERATSLHTTVSSAH